MRLAHLTGAAAILISGLLWAQRFPDLDNRVPELKVTEVFQSGNDLKVTVQNISTRTIRGLSMVLGKHKVVKDWSGFAGGGLLPNATASLTISAAGLPAGGTRHHPAPAGTLELLGAVFVDAAPVTTDISARKEDAPVPVKVAPPAAPPATVTPEPVASNLSPPTRKMEPAPRVTPPAAETPAPVLLTKAPSQWSTSRQSPRLR